MKRKQFFIIAVAFVLLSFVMIRFDSSSSSFFVASSQAPSDPSFVLLGAGAKWASNGDQCVYVSWYDNLQAHPNQYQPNPDVFLPSRTLVHNTLQASGLNVTLAADIPTNLTGVNLLFVEAYFACEPSDAQLIEDYVSNGGGVVLLAATPRYLSVYCKDMWPGNSLDPIADWFGAEEYVNSGGNVYVAVDNPLGTNLSLDQTIFSNPGTSFAAVASVSQDAQVLATWQSGECFAFARTYGRGRVYYQAGYRMPTVLTADFTWTPYSARVAEPVVFDGSLSQPGWNGTYSAPITGYQWSFGDGNVTSTTNTSITHTYASPGLLTITLTVYDSVGDNSTISKTVSVVSSMHVSISTDTASSLIGLSVNIQGTLKDDYGNGQEGDVIVVSYTFAGADTWFPISSATTDDAGQYSLQWIPTASGNFSVMAEWSGNQTYLGTQSVVSLSILPYLNQYVFSVESNSTISALAFNSTSYELTFTASGEPGTRGYAKVTIAKTLVANVQNILVYLDGNPLNYTYTSTQSSWILNFDYPHSTHELTVNLIHAVPENMIPLLLVIIAVGPILLVTRKLNNHRVRIHSSMKV